MHRRRSRGFGPIWSPLAPEDQPYDFEFLDTLEDLVQYKRVLSKRTYLPRVAAQLLLFQRLLSDVKRPNIPQ